MRRLMPLLVYILFRYFVDWFELIIGTGENVRGGESWDESWELRGT